VKLFFCHGLEGSPQGRKVQALRAAGHEVIAPELPTDFDQAVRIATTAAKAESVDLLIGSSRGGAVAMVLARTRLVPLILLAPAWRNNKVDPVVEADTRIIHGIKDVIVPLADSIQLEEDNGLPAGNLIPVNDEHRLSSTLALSALLHAVASFEVAVPSQTVPAQRGVNQIFTIKPYLWEGVWVFDDPERGLIKEALVAGMPEMIELATAQAGIAHPERGFVALFSKDPFPGAMIALEWVREDMGGNVYRWPETNMEGWLCPALFRYFATAPRHLHLAVQAAK
jgi:hypothetical protein